MNLPPGKVLKKNWNDERNPRPRCLCSHRTVYLKKNYKVSLADSIALGFAKENQARLVTSDHHEFDPIDEAGDAKFLWIR